MPELPEVETVCRSLRPHLLGRTISRVRVLEPRLRVRVNEKKLRSLAGKRVDAITRIAKYILFDLSEDAVWLFHLGMSGKLICVEANMARQPRPAPIWPIAGDEKGSLVQVAAVAPRGARSLRSET